MITSFQDMYSSLKERGLRRRMVCAWAVDQHTIEASAAAIKLGIVDAVLVGDGEVILQQCDSLGIDPSVFTIIDQKNELQAIAKAVSLIREGQGDFLMKGLCSTDKFLRAILNKETGILPQGATLLHVGVMQNPFYHKLLFMGDMAVIPLPDLKQKQAILGSVVKVAQSFGLERPKVALVAASEQVLPSMPACMEAPVLSKMAERGQIRGCIVDGPLALDVALDRESAQIKMISSSVAGDADCLVFPNLESSNVFWKTNSKLCQGVQLAGMLVGTTVPCVLSSRADDMQTKLNSIAAAVMFVN